MVLKKEEFDKMMDGYYERRGWDENGVPENGKLEELDMEAFL